MTKHKPSLVVDTAIFGQMSIFCPKPAKEKHNWFLLTISSINKYKVLFFIPKIRKIQVRIHANGIHLFDIEFC